MTATPTPSVPTPLDLTRAPASRDSLEAVPLALITTSVSAKERATTATFMPPAPILQDRSLVLAILDSMELESLALVTFFLCCFLRSCSS